MIIEKYPTLKTILEELGPECILVGSATYRDWKKCKDLDFVVSSKGFEMLHKFESFLFEEKPGWFVYICLDDKDKCADFFFGICDIENKEKHEDRITYEQIEHQSLEVYSICDVDVLGISPL